MIALYIVLVLCGTLILLTVLSLANERSKRRAEAKATAAALESLSKLSALQTGSAPVLNLFGKAGKQQ